MQGVISSFLRTELTIIPQTIRKYVGDYNNTLTNGATWMFFIWTVLHSIFDHAVNRLLTKMHYMEYIRIRLIDAVWNLCFYASCFWYCSATLFKNDVDLFNQKKIIAEDNENTTDNYIIGFIFLITYVLHCALRNFMKQGLAPLPISNLMLSIFLFTTCLTRKLELCYALLAITSFAQCVIEIVRCYVCLVRVTTKMTKFLAKLFLYIALFLFLLSYGFTMSKVIVQPLAHELILKPSCFNLWMLNITLWLWILVEIINNIFSKFLKHMIVHKKTETPRSCLGSTVECTLFPPRDDVAYHLRIVRREIEERRRGQLGLRKPKGKSMLFQTLKSVAMLSMLENTDKEALKDKSPVEMIREGMVAIRRKLNQKRMADSSDSESENENGDVLKCKKENDDGGQECSEEDEETKEDFDGDSEETDEDSDNFKEESN